MTLRPALLRALAEKVGIALAMAAAVAALTLWAVTWRTDAWLFDRLQRLEAPAASDDIVVVAIDDASLGEIGRWPWPRDVHAQLIRRLDAAGVRGIGFDVLFAEPDRDHPEADAALVDAIRASGKVVLPVLAEASPRDGTLIEVLPIGPLIGASAGLGHVEIDLDPDGVARSAHLYAGLGSAHWPALALALRNLHAPTRRDAPLPGLRNPGSAEAPSPYLWSRDYRILLPRPDPDNLQRASYVDVLQGRIPDALLRDRWILVGATAAGMGHDILVPGRGRERPISGVEYHASVLDTLLLDRAVTPLPPARQLLLGVALALLPLLVHRPRHAWRRPWLALTVAALATLAASTMLLAQARLWFAPSATLAVLAAAGLGAWLLQGVLSRRRARLERMGRVGDRRVFEMTLDRELASARRSNRPLSLLLLELDDFQGYAEAQGERAADALLRVTAETLVRHARRPRDLPARLDGEGFALLLPECSASAATAIAQSILDDLRARAIPHPDSSTGSCATASIGVANYYPILELHEVDLVKRAEAALFRAQREGRDRAHCSSAATAP
ncbi:MAG TPA: CHASE2 domain-containing protein [Luteimonas sp.]|nr:CHASE2 domain-containing protein [Luteimonas sp.]HRP71449.1 CHASE2 domain-containing protein [Luteimonas sp.]